MANVKAVIDVDINTSPAAAGLRSLQGQFNAFAQTLNTANASHSRFAKETTQQLSGLVNSTQFFTAETVRMRTAASQLDMTLAKGGATMGQFFSARFRKDGLAAAQVMSLANARASAMQTQFIATGQAAGGMREALAIRPLQAFNSAAVVSAQKLAIQRAMLNQATTSMINFGKNTQWAGRQLMVGFTVPLTIFAGVAGKAFRELEKEAINFRKVYGDIFTTDVETERALEGVKNLTKEFTKYGVQAQKTMQLAAIAAQAGKTGAELMAATTEATRLAVLGNMENEEAMRSTIAIQSAFKMSNEELSESINFLNMVNNATVLSLKDVAESIPRVAPVIEGLGGDVKELAVMLVAMREGGVSAAEAANGLKSSLGRLITPSRQAKEMAESFGINLDRLVRKNAGDLLGTITELADAMKDLGDLEKQQLLSTLFGKFQFARIGALFENITRDGSQAQKAMEMMGMSAADAASIAERELSAIQDSVATKFTAAIEQMKLAIAPIGEMFLKMAIPIVNFFAKIAESFNNLPDFAKNFIAFGSALVGLVIPAGTMFAGLLMNLIGTLVKVGHLIGLAFKGFISGGISGAINNVSQALNYMSLEQIDATNSASQLAGATGLANDAFVKQVGAAAGARSATNQLGIAYDILYQRIMKIASANAAAFGPGITAMGAAGVAGPATARAAARGITLTRLNKGGTAPGTGNKDTVPAMLTPGEFVVNKQATQENLPILHAINNGKNIPGFNKGGQIPGMQYFNRFMAQRVVQPSLITTQDDLLARMAALQGFKPSEPVTRQSVRIGSMSRSESIYQKLMAKNADKSTKNARVVRFAVEQLGISPGELGLKSRGNFGFALTQESNIKMANGTLTRQELLQDIMNPASLNPLSDQFSRYFKMGVDRNKFLKIFESSAKSLPVDLITNKRFEQISRRALYQYLRTERIPREQAGSFMKDILSQTEVSSGLSLGRLEEALALRGINATRGGRKDFYVNHQGEQLNLGRLLGQEIDSLAKPSDIIRFTRQRDSKALVPKGLVFAHANKGGMIPGMQYFAAKNQQRVVRELSHLDEDLLIPKEAKRDFFNLGTTKGSRAKSAFVASYPRWVNQDARAGNLDKMRFISYLRNAGPEDYQLLFEEMQIPENKRASLARTINKKIVKDLLMSRENILSDDGRKGTIKFSNVGKSFYEATPAENKKTLEKIRTTVAEIREPRESGRGTERRFRKSSDLAIVKAMATVAKKKSPVLRGGAPGIWNVMRLALRRNKGGIIPGGEVDTNRSFYGRFNAKTVELFRKWISSQSPEIAATKAAILKDPVLARGMGAGFRSSRKAETLQRATFMRELPKPGETISLGSLASFSPKGTSVSQHLRDSQIRKDAEFASYLIGTDQKHQRQSAARLREVLRDPGAVESWAPERRFFDPKTRETGLEAWIKNEQRMIQSRREEIKRNKAIVRQYNSLEPTIIEVKTPRGTVRANLNDIVSKTEQQYLGKPVAENERILHNAQIKIGDIKRGEDGITRIFASLLSSSRPRLNLGGIIPGYNNGGDVQAFMQGSIFESAKKTIVPGVGNTDTVPAALTPGEFVINKQATKQNLGLLHAINSGKAIGMNKGGGVAEQGRMFYGNMGQDIRKMMTAFGSQGMRITKEEAALYIKQGIKISDVRKGILPQRSTGGTGGMGGMRGMGASMGMAMGGMGVMMIGQQMQASAAERGETSAVGTALSTGGMGLSMASILPFLPFAKILAPVVLAAGAAAGGLYILRKISDDVARKGQELGSNMGGAANALNEIAEMAGVATPLQRAAKLQLGITEKEEALLQESEAVQSIVQSESGQKFIDELSKLTSAERYEKLLSYLQYGVATDIFDMQTAKAFGKTIAAEIGDPAVGAAVAQRIGTQKAGAQGLINLAQERVQRIDPLIERTQGRDVIGSMDANKIIGGSLQIIQDFANAEALARQQFAEGEISYDELSAIIERSAEVQNSYTDAVQGALEKTDALGSTMLGLKEALVSSGLTEEQAGAIEKAGQNVVFEINQKDIDVGKFITSSLVGGPALGAARAQMVDLDLLGRGQAGLRQAFLSKDRSPGAVAGAFFGGEVREVDEKRTSQLQTLAMSMALTPEDIAAFGTLLSENKNLADRFDQLVDQGVGEAKAAQGIVLAQKAIEGQFLGGAGRRFEEGERESLEASLKEKPSSLRGAEQQDEARRILAEFDALEKKKIEIAAEISTKGIDPVAFETYINSIPQFKQLEIAANISGMTPESATRFLSDAQILGSSVGNEIGLGIQESSAYKKALDKGQTEPLVRAFKEASEAGVSESVIKYAIKTEGANSPEDLQNKIKELTASTKAINELPDEMIKGLGINLENPEDVEKFGPMASQLAENWKIIENLNPNIDLVAAMEFLTMENGKPKTPLQAAASVTKLNKAYRNLGSKDESVRKKAIFEIATAYAGEEGGDFTPEQVEQSLATLRENFAKLDSMDPQIVAQLIQIQIETDIQGAKEAAEILSLVATLDRIPDPQEKAMTLRRIDSLQSSQKARQEAALARQKAISSTVAPSGTGGGGGGGGGGQKSLSEQLSEQLKQVKELFNAIDKAINAKGFKAFIAGPFAPEFLEYLKGQGEEGLKILKGGIDKIKKEYEKFQKIRIFEIGAQSAAAPFLRQEEIARGGQRNRFNQRLRTGSRFKMGGQGLSEQEIEYVTQAIDPQTLATLNMLESQSKLSKEEKRVLQKIRNDIREAIKQSRESTFQEDIDGFRSGIQQAEQDVAHFNNLVSKGIDPALAQSMIDMGVTASIAANRTTEELEMMSRRVQRLNLANTIKEIGMNLMEMGKSIALDFGLMSMGYTGDFAEELKQLGVNFDLLKNKPQIVRAAADALKGLKLAAYQAKDPLAKISENFDLQVSSLQASVEAINRLEIRPFELQIRGIQDAMIPFNDEIKRLEKLIKPLQKEINGFQKEIDGLQKKQKPLQKDIEKLREEETALNKDYDERSKVLDKVSRANEKMIAQQKGQLDIASALSRGDIAGAARATRELQATMAQQRMDDAKAALEEEREKKRLEITTQIETKEKEIKNINEQIELIQEQIEARQESISNYQELIADQQDLIAEKQEQIEKIQRQIEDSKRKQLELEEKIYKVQLLQSMLATKQAIQQAAMVGNVAGVQLGQQQLQAQLSVAGPDPSAFFGGIQGAEGILAAVQPMATMQIGAIIEANMVRSQDLSRMIAESMERADSYFKTQMEPSAQAIVESFLNGEIEFSDLLLQLSEAGVNVTDFLQDVFNPSMSDMLGGIAQGTEAFGTGFLSTLELFMDGLVKGLNAFFSKVEESVGALNIVIPSIPVSISGSVSGSDGKGNSFSMGVSGSGSSSRGETKAKPGKVKRIKRAFGGMISYKGSTEPPPGMMMGGIMKKYANGAFVPGVGITDSVPALLTPGEFVVRKPVAQAFGPLLQSLNSQIYPQMQQFAMGGFAGSGMNSMFPSFKGVSRIKTFPTMSGNASNIRVSGMRGTAQRDGVNVEYNYSVNVNAETNASPDDIANAVIYKFRRMEARQVRGTRVG